MDGLEDLAEVEALLAALGLDGGEFRLAHGEGGHLLPGVVAYRDGLRLDVVAQERLGGGVGECSLLGIDGGLRRELGLHQRGRGASHPPLRRGRR